MIPAGSYPIEDFLEAITAQLDKTQDALRLKSVNRPLTFALKDFNLDLKVFVEMDEQGQIRIRPSRPNEEGASTVNIGFTTITKPMIEENTVSLELTKSPTLEEVGLKPVEQRKLERLGVRNAAQLKKLESEAGDRNLSRMSGINISKLRQALQMERSDDKKINMEIQDNAIDDMQRLKSGSDVRNRAGAQNNPAGPKKQRGRIQVEEVTGKSNVGKKLQRLDISDKARRLKLRGINILENGQAPSAKLNQKFLSLVNSIKDMEDEIEIELPDQCRGGVLEIGLPDGTVEAYDLVVNKTNGDRVDSDPWVPS